MREALKKCRDLLLGTPEAEEDETEVGDECADPLHDSAWRNCIAPPGSGVQRGARGTIGEGRGLSSCRARELSVQE